MQQINFKFIPLILVLIFSIPGAKCLPQSKTISIKDLGYVPGSHRNVIPFVVEALKQCESSEAVTIVFPKGRYDFWQDFSKTSSRFSIGFPMENLKNVVINGDSSEFIFHGNMQIANISKCENITFKNFTVDWDFPFIYEGRYLNSTDEYIELEFDKDQYRYVIEDGKFYLTGEGWKAAPTGYFNMFDRDTKEILYKTHDGNNSQLITGKAEEVSPGIVRFYGKPNIKPPKGTYTAFMAGRYMTTGINITGSKDVYLKDLTIYHALSHAVVGSRSENITMDNANIKINEKKGRVTSIIADNSHFLNCKGSIKIINCAHTGAHDDFINVHGTYSKIDSIIGNNIVITSRLNGENGDEIWFVNPSLCQRSDSRIIKSVELVDNRKAKITFETPLPKEIVAGNYMENKTWTPELEIRNCRILKQHRARGILVTTPKKVIIEDNYFRTAGTAILIEGDMDYWFESGANRDVTIRNNVFDNCLTSGCISGNRWEWGEGIITITPSHRPQDDKTEPYHQNIRIENNIFKTFDVPLIHARSVRGLFFRNNEIIKTYAFEPYLWQKSSFLLDGCRDVVIKENKIHNEYVTRTIVAEHMKKSDVKSEDFSLILK
ncbi:MAG TPA: hypothetical protein DEB12_11265 [Porphyromonadaceae bacterium]|jgi:hypothetical protein|uniref:alpha-1,3-galactosidase-related protein n=1 Tax=Petrimonas sp. TaxID=2023866 RepID=UPI000E826134|nr:hypothetical protein [Tissierellia bacterium]HBT86468.1 hypothetical protein [Porphyromonadaceae bacterium]